MVTNSMFLPKYFDFFKKWTKKMSKIENPKYFLVNFIVNIIKNIKQLKEYHLDISQILQYSISLDLSGSISI